MIGNIPELTFPTAVNKAIPSAVLNVPLPFFYSRDSGVALPTAALPYNEMRINFSFRDWSQLLVLDNIYGTNTANSLQTLAGNNYSVTASQLVGGAAPVLGVNTQVWANYAIVSNDERKRMACAPRDILVEQVQTAPRQTFAPLTNRQPSYDVRFSHAIKVLFFGVRDTTVASSWSNYTVTQPSVVGATNTEIDTVYAPFVSYKYLLDYLGADPIQHTSLIYENTNRLSQMTSDYYSLVNPFYSAPVIPLETGYHTYSYSLDFICLDPMGSTNYGKLTNVSVIPYGSSDAVLYAGAAPGSFTNGNTPTAYYYGQTYEFILTAVNNNIIRVSGGALGFPVL